MILFAFTIWPCPLCKVHHLPGREGNTPWTEGDTAKVSLNCVASCTATLEGATGISCLHWVGGWGWRKLGYFGRIWRDPWQTRSPFGEVFPHDWSEGVSPHGSSAPAGPCGVASEMGVPLPMAGLWRASTRAVPALCLVVTAARKHCQGGRGLGARGEGRAHPQLAWDTLAAQPAWPSLCSHPHPGTPPQGVQNRPFLKLIILAELLWAGEAVYVCRDVIYAPQTAAIQLKLQQPRGSPPSPLCLQCHPRGTGSCWGSRWGSHRGSGVVGGQWRAAGASGSACEALSTAQESMVWYRHPEKSWNGNSVLLRCFAPKSCFYQFQIINCVSIFLLLFSPR